MILSIIIPVFNMEYYVEKCIRSCAEQDILPTEYEIICVNDGSTDNSLDIIKRVSSDYNNIRIICKENEGLSAARNTGIEHAIGDYYMFVDSDDWLDAKVMYKIVKILKKERPDCLTFCGANVYDNIQDKRIEYPNEGCISGKDYLLEGYQDASVFGIWRASFWKKNRLEFYKGIYHEDSELIPRAFYLANSVYRLNDIVYNVRQTPNSITRAHRPKRAFDILNVVAPHLSMFTQNVDSHHLCVFNDKISMALNNSIREICYADKKQYTKFKKDFKGKFYLTKHLRNSNNLKYKFEGYCLSLFGVSIIDIVRFYIRCARRS